MNCAGNNELVVLSMIFASRIECDIERHQAQGKYLQALFNQGDQADVVKAFHDAVAQLPTLRRVVLEDYLNGMVAKSSAIHIGITRKECERQRMVAWQLLAEKLEAFRPKLCDGTPAGGSVASEDLSQDSTDPPGLTETSNLLNDPMADVMVKFEDVFPQLRANSQQGRADRTTVGDFLSRAYLRDGEKGLKWLLREANQVLSRSASLRNPLACWVSRVKKKYSIKQTA